MTDYSGYRNAILEEAARDVENAFIAHSADFILCGDTLAYIANHIRALRAAGASEGRQPEPSPASGRAMIRGAAQVPPPLLPITDRNTRQAMVAEWCLAAFGEGQASSVPQRGVRLLEEAVEAAQAAGVERAMAHTLVDFVFDRPAGTVAQELGGVGVTALALAHAAGLSADAEEAREVARVLAKPVAHFTARNKAKNDSGFLVPEQEGVEAGLPEGASSPRSTSDSPPSPTPENRSMHTLMLRQVVLHCLRRAGEGDCPTVPPLSVEILEEAICEMERQRTTAWLERKLAVDPDGDPQAGPELVTAMSIPSPTPVQGDLIEAALRDALKRMLNVFDTPPSEGGMLAGAEQETCAFARAALANAEARPAADAVEHQNVKPIRRKPGQTPVNHPFERLPQSASDPGFGPLPIPENNMTRQEGREEGQMGYLWPGITKGQRAYIETIWDLGSRGREEALAIIDGFLKCPEIADCAPEDKDPETDALERRARALKSSSLPRGK